MPPASNLYYHGTTSIRAAEALSGGEPLKAMAPAARPGDKKAKMAGSAPRTAYLTPSLWVACRYARMVTRLDRPQRSTLGDDYDGRGWVFAFEISSMDQEVRLEEDDLGHAVRLALEVEAGWHDGFARYEDGRRTPKLLLNPQFGTALADSPDLLARIADEARGRLPASVLNVVKTWRTPTANDIAYVGQRFGRVIGDEMSADLIAAGISIAVQTAVRAKQGWLWMTPGLTQTDRPLPKNEGDFLAVAEPVEIAERTPKLARR